MGAKWQMGPMYLYVFSGVIPGFEPFFSKTERSYKIGISHEPNARLKSVKYARNIEHTIELPVRSWAYRCERMLHALYRDHAIPGHSEWFDLFNSEIDILRGLANFDDVYEYVKQIRAENGTTWHFGSVTRG